MAGDKQLPAGALCRYCSKSVTSGLKCVICSSSFHSSCAKRVKGVKFINDSTVNCCETCDVYEPVSDEQGKNKLTEILEQNRHLKEENRLLESLLISKDEIVTSLREEIHLLKENILLLRELNSIKVGNVNDNISEVEVLSVDKKVQRKKTKNTNDNKNVNESNGHRFTISETADIIKNVNKEILATKQMDKMNEIITFKDPKTSADDTDGFKLVQYKSARKTDSSGNNYRKQNYGNKFNITVGTKLPDENSAFKARPSKMWVYVGKVNEGVSKETVEKYIRDRCSISTASDLVVEELPTVGRSPSFRVGVDNKYYEQLKLPDFWPSGIIIRRYNFRVNKIKPSEEEPGKSAAVFLGRQN